MWLQQPYLVMLALESRKRGYAHVLKPCPFLRASRCSSFVAWCWLAGWLAVCYTCSIWGQVINVCLRLVCTDICIRETRAYTYTRTHAQLSISDHKTVQKVAFPCFLLPVHRAVLSPLPSSRCGPLHCEKGKRGKSSMIDVLYTMNH
jgi:hypothetical protein